MGERRLGRRGLAELWQPSPQYAVQLRGFELEDHRQEGEVGLSEEQPLQPSRGEPVIFNFCLTLARGGSQGIKACMHLPRSKVSRGDVQIYDIFVCLSMRRSSGVS